MTQTVEEIKGGERLHFYSVDFNTGVGEWYEV